eukprot:scaffold132316_cov27-Tisochrysis_lutea.AAC.2
MARHPARHRWAIRPPRRASSTPASLASSSVAGSWRNHATARARRCRCASHRNSPVPKKSGGVPISTLGRVAEQASAFANRWPCASVWRKVYGDGGRSFSTAAPSPSIEELGELSERSVAHGLVPNDGWGAGVLSVREMPNSPRSTGLRTSQPAAALGHGKARRHDGDSVGRHRSGHTQIKTSPSESREASRGSLGCGTTASMEASAWWPPIVIWRSLSPVWERSTLMAASRKSLMPRATDICWARLPPLERDQRPGWRHRGQARRGGSKLPRSSRSQWRQGTARTEVRHAAGSPRSSPANSRRAPRGQGSGLQAVGLRKHKHGRGVAQGVGCGRRATPWVYTVDGRKARGQATQQRCRPLEHRARSHAARATTAAAWACPHRYRAVETEQAHTGSDVLRRVAACQPCRPAERGALPTGGATARAGTRFRHRRTQGLGVPCGRRRPAGGTAAAAGPLSQCLMGRPRPCHPIGAKAEQHACLVAADAAACKRQARACRSTPLNGTDVSRMRQVGKREVAHMRPGRATAPPAARRPLCVVGAVRLLGMPHLDESVGLAYTRQEGFTRLGSGKQRGGLRQPPPPYHTPSVRALAPVAEVAPSCHPELAHAAISSAPPDAIHALLVVQ